MKKEISKALIERSVRVSKAGTFVSSDFIAKVFDKRHTHVLDKIRENIDNLAAENSVAKSYFIDNSYVDSRGKNQPRYNLTRKGFDLLVLGMTGAKAFKYKIWFIDEFHKKDNFIAKQKAIVSQHTQNNMWLSVRGETKPAREVLTDTIQEHELPLRKSEGKAVENFVKCRIINYTRLVYKALGIKTQSGVDPRDSLEPRGLYELESLEYEVASMIKENIMVKECHYKQCYALIKKELLATRKIS